MFFSYASLHDKREFDNDGDKMNVVRIENYGSLKYM